MKDHQMTMLSSERKAGEFHDGLRFAGAWATTPIDRSDTTCNKK